MESTPMKYIRLGKAGIKVSRLGYGNWINDNSGDQVKSDELVKLAFEAGINFFDTAENYGADGIAERTLGKSLIALGADRGDLIVSTKLFFGDRYTNRNKIRHNVIGSTRKHLVEGINQSLKNLQLDYVDIMYLHRYDQDVEIEETIMSIKHLIDSGKILYWGTSEWPAIRIMQAMYVCDKLGCPRPISEQCEYSMLQRENLEKNYLPLINEFGLGSTVWSPLCSGILSGKYNDGTIPDGSRFQTNTHLQKMFFDRYLGPEVFPKTVAKLKKLGEMAESLNCTMAQLALAWCISWNGCSLAIMGVTSAEQLKSN